MTFENETRRIDREFIAPRLSQVWVALIVHRNCHVKPFTFKVDWNLAIKKILWLPDLKQHNHGNLLLMVMSKNPNYWLYSVFASFEFTCISDLNNFRLDLDNQTWVHSYTFRCILFYFVLCGLFSSFTNTLLLLRSSFEWWPRVFVFILLTCRG